MRTNRIGHPFQCVMTTRASESRTGLRYQPDERPPVAPAFGLGVQIAVLTIAAIILVPTIEMRAAGASENYLSWAVFGTVAICGATTVLQSIRTGRIGSGHVLIVGASGAFIAVCINAVAAEGPGLACHSGHRLLPRSTSDFRAPHAVPADLDDDGLGHRDHADSGHGDACR